MKKLLQKEPEKISRRRKIINDLLLASLVLAFLLTPLSISALLIVYYAITIPLFILKMVITREGFVKTGVELFIAIFLFIAFISSLTSYFASPDFGGIYMKNSLKWFYKTAPAILIFIIVVQGGYRRWARVLASAFLLGSVLNCICLITQFLTHLKDLNVYFDRFGGFSFYMTQGTIIPLSLCVASWLIVNEHIRKYHWLDLCLRWAGYIITIIASALSLVRTAILGTTTAIVTFTVITRKKLFIITLVGVIIMVLLIPQTRFRLIDTFYSFDYQGYVWEPESIKEWRWRLFPIGIDIIKRYPLLGVGPRNVSLIISEYRPYETGQFFSHLHNDFLEVGAEMGLIGLSALVALFIAIYVSIIKKSKERKYTRAFGISIIFTFVTAGMFEYNIGDFEAFISFWEVLSIAFLYLYGRE
ncbi:MAG: hypothetical protein B6D57_00765 [Candidatus Coatesbacteria bacterium 4484_99]|uniref:O-antigen ligase-related domain-containing protein n=1 Tax=Candidatus Coatesbacteria bacterium 4484_99 TaxID=1970774 RepID=A0A1W9S4B9_9BACT|nr:MAG: hypothetical protein B6D57_00765 [Candidatus Coatesbacteria bacterium 4484_99]